MWENQHMSEAVPMPRPINWEAVKALAAVVGVREAARRMELSEDRVRQRSCREKWLDSPDARKAVQLAHNARTMEKSVTTLSPAALISSEIASLGSKTRLSLARGVSKAAEHVESLSGSEILEKSADVKAVAQTADLVHGWKDAAPQVKIRLDVLSGSNEAPAIEVEADVTGYETEVCPVDPLDEY